MTEPLFPGAAVDVAVIGGGPAGLAAATALKAAGVARVIVLERDARAGGIPRHCGHKPFGLREFHRVLSGPDYAARLVARTQAQGVELHTRATVIETRPGGELLISTPERCGTLTARRVILATGVREKPRAARLISGDRVAGVLNTGALQAMVYLEHRRPFRRPVILGSELVAFSALMTCAHAGIRPLAMIEPGPRTTARWPAALFARLKGVDMLTDTELASIEGRRTVEAVRLRSADGSEQRLACDGVIVSGAFTPESTLARCGRLDIDPGTGGPVVDQWGRCSDPAYFATGNLLRPVETAGWSWNEGRQSGTWVAQDLAGLLPPPAVTVPIAVSDPRLKYVMPQRLGLGDATSGMAALQLRLRTPISGRLVVRSGDRVLWQGRLNSRPERRILVPIRALSAATEGVEITMEPASLTE